MKASSILSQAESIVGGDRQTTHGAPERNFATIGAYWSAYLTAKLGTPTAISPADVARMMVLLKMGRVQSGSAGAPDHYIDMAGYAGLAGELEDMDEEQNTAGTHPFR